MVKMEHNGGADFAILQDDDYEGNDAGTQNRAYILYGAWHHYGMSQSDWRFNYYPDWAKNGHQIAIQELDPATFTHPVGPSTRVTTNGQESPSIFKRNGVCTTLFMEICAVFANGAQTPKYWHLATRWDHSNMSPTSTI